MWPHAWSIPYNVSMGPSDTVKRYVEDEMRSDTPSKAWLKESTVLGPIAQMAGGAHRHVGWWGGKLTAYDPKTKKHKIEWDDGDDPWNEDLLNMRKAKEWRFLLKGEKKEDIVQSMD